ncbi:putative ribonuclease H-like domain-containing protein [Tanacetum coccineum]
MLLRIKGIVDSGMLPGNAWATMATCWNFKILMVDRPVALGGGSRGYITGKGKIKTGKLDFEDVCFVKELQHFNLFSVSQICDKKNKVLFTDSECLVLSSEFKLPDENQVLLKIPRQNNMYSFNLENIVPSGGLACLIAKATTDESNKWHRRLGHVNFKNLNRLVKGNLVRGLPSKIFQNDHTCVACQKGKQHKASCKAKAVSSISHSLQLLHMDLFGPTSVRSLNHKTYCLVITDDFSRFSWVFFLRTKDETSAILKDFIRQIENQLNQKVKTIRSDNGTEFKNKDVIEFCGSKGIKREYSNARTPQQNGVAERKNRTLIEAARTMLADSFLPNTFWAEAVSQQEANQNASTEDIIDAGDSKTEDESTQDSFVLPIWPSYSSIVTPDLKTAEKRDGPREEEQVEVCDLGYTRRRCAADDADFTNLETVVNVSHIPTSRFHSTHPKALILGDPNSAVQTRSKLHKSSGAHAFVSYVLKGKTQTGSLYATSCLIEPGILLRCDFAGANLDRKSHYRRCQFWFHVDNDFFTRSFNSSCSSTVSHVVSTTFVEQFWTSAKSKTINNVRHITSKVAGKSVSISKASIRSDFLFDDADGIDSLPNQAIFDAIQLMGYEGDLTDEGASSHRSSEAEPTPSPAPTSEVPNEPQTDSSPAQTSEIKLLSMAKSVSLKQRFLSKRFSKENIGCTKESVSKTGRRLLKDEGKDKENVDKDKKRLVLKRHARYEEHIEGTEEQIESTEEQREGTEEKVESTDGQRKGVEDQTEEEIASNKLKQLLKLGLRPDRSLMKSFARTRKRAQFTLKKGQRNYKHAELKVKKFKEVQALYEKIKRSDEDFISIGSVEDERLIKKMNEKGVDLSKSEVITEESKEEVQKESKEEESTRKRKLGTRKKMKSRKRRYIQNTSEDDSDKENDELRLHLTIAPDEEKEVDFEILDRKYPIKEWKQIEDLNAVLAWYGQISRWKYMKQDWNIVSWKLHGSSGVHTLVTETGLVIHMLVEKRYPLRKQVLMQMLKLKLESEEDSTMSLELIRLIKKILAELESKEQD